MPKDRGYKNLIKFCVLNWISTIDGAKEGAVGLDNSVEAPKEDFNNFIQLRREAIWVGLGEKDKFVEVLQNNFFKGLSIERSFGPAHPDGVPAQFPSASSGWAKVIMSFSGCFLFALDTTPPWAKGLPAHCHFCK